MQRVAPKSSARWPTGARPPCTPLGAVGHPTTWAPTLPVPVQSRRVEVCAFHPLMVLQQRWCSTPTWRRCVASILRKDFAPLQGARSRRDAEGPQESCHLQVLQLCDRWIRQLVARARQAEIDATMPSYVSTWHRMRRAPPDAHGSAPAFAHMASRCGREDYVARHGHGRLRLPESLWSLLAEAAAWTRQAREHVWDPDETAARDRVPRADHGHGAVPQGAHPADVCTPMVCVLSAEPASIAAVEQATVSWRAQSTRPLYRHVRHRVCDSDVRPGAHLRLWQRLVPSPLLPLL